MELSPNLSGPSRLRIIIGVVWALLLMCLWALDAAAQTRPIRGSVDMWVQSLQTATADLASEATRDAEILNLIRESVRALDGTQKNNAVRRSLEKIAKAKSLAVQSKPAVKEAVRIAEEILAPAEESPMSADLERIQQELRRRSFERMQRIVAEEIDELARVTTRLTDLTATLARAISVASSATVGRTAE